EFGNERIRGERAHGRGFRRRPPWTPRPVRHVGQKTAHFLQENSPFALDTSHNDLRRSGLLPDGTERPLRRRTDPQYPFRAEHLMNTRTMNDGSGDRARRLGPSPNGANGERSAGPCQAVTTAGGAAGVEAGANRQAEGRAPSANGANGERTRLSP